ncbi:GHKL domain-containing protein [Shewanella sp. 202IG2-18]|uniref:ATP-binding protein n=1 Tax=Parashewanella hymeniacidonis TaxID=2807618 RepID=UPI001961A87C|nr:ATP-binding protein [Parashewanella hymeniacidonis]MBM7072055.1 GHKL domain-containing protein [Parashewanella hymeniacidonis]
MLLSSFIIIFVLGTSLAWLINELHAQKVYNFQTEELMADLPQAIKNIKQQHFEGLNDANIMAATNPIDFIMVSCDENYKQVWTSKLASHRNLEHICTKYRAISSQKPPYYLQLDDGKDYLIYSIPLEANMKRFELLVLKDAKGFSKEYEVYSKHTYVELLIILTITFIFMLIAAFWGLKPFRNMRKELNQIKKGQKEEVDGLYPAEFKTLSLSINRLIKQSHAQAERYKNTSDDLAHNLKTRLASIKVLVEDTEIIDTEVKRQISEQVFQIDNSVNYHLKRASLGRNSLKDERTELYPAIAELENVLNKIYQEKNIYLSQDLEPNINFPGDKDNLTELCGNLLENAYKLCLSKVHIESYTANETFFLIIEDDGKGIDPNIKESILERGFRADTQHDGSGIGLAVCHEIITSYNGQIKFEDSRLGGAKVVIKIPIN